MEDNIFDLEKHKNDLLFLPLGGSGEVTMNCNLYYCDGKWIIIDMGVAFARDLPGVNVILPDISFIKKHIKDFLGIFITHAHEDHIGAIQYLIQELKLPIYASKFAATFLKAKLSEYVWGRKVKILEFPTNGILNIKPFVLETISLTHSIPEMNAILVRTSKGNILHTGDWRFEDRPVIGSPSNKKRLKELGDKGSVLAMVCESTNIFSEKETKSETDLKDSLKDIIGGLKTGLVVVGVFATNISRIISLAVAARAVGRKIGVLGRAINTTLKVAVDMKYLPRDMELVDEDKFAKMDKSKLFLIATGCQGQENSGLGRLAEGTYKNLKLEKGDTVIFSASEIPGNEIEISNLYNKLAEKEVRIINTHNAFVHISGHYTKNELVEMYELVRPKIAISTHGDAMKLIEHKRIAEELGIKSVIRGRNGCVFKIDADGIIDEVGNIKVVNHVMDGKRNISINNVALLDRQRMAESGIIIVNFIVDKNLKLLSPMEVTAVGNYHLLHERAIYENLRNLAYKGYRIAFNVMNNPEHKENFGTDDKKEMKIEKEIRTQINPYMYENYGKEPIIIVKMLREANMIDSNSNILNKDLSKRENKVERVVIKKHS